MISHKLLSSAQLLDLHLWLSTNLTKDHRYYCTMFSISRYPNMVYPRVRCIIFATDHFRLLVNTNNTIGHCNPAAPYHNYSRSFKIVQ